jgi:hypothetical protein
MLTFSRQLWRVKLAHITANSQLCPHRKHSQLLPHAQTGNYVKHYMIYCVNIHHSYWSWSKSVHVMTAKRGVGKFALGSIYSRVHVH